MFNKDDQHRLSVLDQVRFESSLFNAFVSGLFSAPAPSVMVHFTAFIPK